MVRSLCSTTGAKAVARHDGDVVWEKENLGHHAICATEMTSIEETA